MNGVQFLFVGLISIWASANNEDFTFFTAVVIYSVFALLTFVKVVGTNFAKYTNMVFSWGVMFFVCTILSIVVLTAQDSDAKQLAAFAEGDGLSAGGVLWFFAVFHLLGSLNNLLCTFDSFASMGASLYIKEPYELDQFGKGIQRMNAASGLGVGVVFLWAAMNHGKDLANLTDTGFQFPLTMVIGKAHILTSLPLFNVLPNIAI